MTHKLGTNQHEVKRRYHFWPSVWIIFLIFTTVLFVLTTVILTIKLTEPEVISPLSDNPSFQIYAAEPDGVRETVLLRYIKEFGTNGIEEFDKLIMKESSWNYKAINPTSGAGGLFQALPFSKTGCLLEDLQCQVSWGFKYIQSRYGSAIQAYKFHLANGWY